MSIFNAFNKLNNSISSTFGNIRQTAQTINSVTANINRVQSQYSSFIGGNSSAARGLGEISNTARNMRKSLGAIDNVITGSTSSSGNVGTAIRMASNASQDIGFNASPPTKSVIQAVVSKALSTLTSPDDWRVSLSVPGVILGAAGATMLPLAATGSKMIFPFTPTILLSHTANYSTVHPIHTNYAYYAYENSQVDNITLTGEFIQENKDDAEYWLASLHYLRTMTKMFYGSSDSPLGNPPPVCRLNGYGKYVLNDIPVVITNFTTDLPQDVDYIECDFAGEKNWVPTQCTFTITVAPTYARRSHSRFSLQDFASGAHTRTPEGFV